MDIQNNSTGEYLTTITSFFSPFELLRTLTPAYPTPASSTTLDLGDTIVGNACDPTLGDTPLEWVLG